MNSVVIVGAKRTPIGAYRGQLAALAAPELGAVAIRALLEDCRLDPTAIDEVFMGCVLPAGLGQAPARQAALAAGVPLAAGCTTVNKVCGSGMKAVMLGCDAIAAGSAAVVVAGGMESMSNAPYLVRRSLLGQRPGHEALLDHMFYDGLENPADRQLMGYFAEQCVDRYGFTREGQDAFAAESVRRALAAIESGAFRAEIAPVCCGGQKIDEDETPHKCDPAKISKLKPAFRPATGTVTAANSSSISDGAAALLLMAESEAKRLGLTPLLRIAGSASHAQAPEEFTTAPIAAIRNLYQKVGWQDRDVDLYEINEAFAAVTLAAERTLALDHAKVNVHGGACALGHPIGASGARIIVTLGHALRRHGLRRGIAALCIGGGEATAIALELI
ncbi:MAG: acetyl-CoA C-acyltransferase [Pseudomonadota bacterium]|nr:acetyl-CoA C-acyltransferase [Pseudomonadota bacterium]